MWIKHSESLNDQAPRPMVSEFSLNMCMQNNHLLFSVLPSSAYAVFIDYNVECGAGGKRKE